MPKADIPTRKHEETFFPIPSNGLRICKCVLHHTKTLGIIEIEPTVWKHLTDDEKAEILRICDEKLDKYFERISGDKN